MKSGICKYCLTQKSLVDSHLMPKALYRRVGVDGQLLRQSAKEVRLTNAQLKEQLLCAECDQSLSINGESWAVPLLAFKDGRFPLYGLLTKIPAEHVAEGIEVYATIRNPNIDIRKLTHFGTAIFWKASVHSWTTKDGNLIELGPYGDELRKFLRSESAFPAYVALTVCVQPPPVKHVGFCPPYKSTLSSSGLCVYAFHVPGMMFRLHVGKGVRSEGMKTICFHSNSHHPLYLYDHSRDIDLNLRSLTKSARISPRVLARVTNFSKIP